MLRSSGQDSLLLVVGGLDDSLISVGDASDLILRNVKDSLHVVLK